MRISTISPWIVAATLTLIACDTKDPLMPGQQAEARVAAEHEFVAELMMTDLLMVLPGMIGETEEASTFFGRCEPAAAWLSYFGITGTMPHLGRVDGSASHCVYLDPTEEFEVRYDQGSGWLRSASGDDALLEYGDGRAWRAGDGAMAFEDAWTFVGGTGRFAGLTGTGTGFGTFTDQQLVAGEGVGYLMRGTMAYDASNGSNGPTFRARARLEMRMPFFDVGNLWEDPCFTDPSLPGMYNPYLPGPGVWVQVVQAGPGTGTHLGDFWLEAEYCTNVLTSQTTERINRGVTASGATFEILCTGDVPLFVQGLNRTYAVRAREQLTGLTGNLAGVTGLGWNSGRIESRFTPEGMPIRPMIFEVDIVGSLNR
jgi:hypothetical protein